jgi:hypothetical protein
VEEPKPEGGEAKKLSGEKRGEEDLNLLRWLAKEKLDGFVDWKPVEHPSFPGKKVEVGGFKPFYTLNPPAKELDSLADKHLQFATALPKWLPKIAITEAKAESLGGGVYRITATVVNRGFLPTMPEMGQVNGEVFPLQISLTLPKGAALLQGNQRTKLPRIDGGGGKTEKTWLLRLGEEKPKSIEIQAWSPAVGRATATVALP